MIDLSKSDVRLSDLLRFCVLAYAQEKKSSVQLDGAGCWLTG